MRNRRWAATSVLAMVILWSIGGCGDDRPPGFSGSGVIEATEVTVGAELMGRIVELRFDEGRKVAAGDTLLVLDTDELVLERDAVGTKLDDIDWQERILAREREAAREQVRQAKASLDLLEKNRLRIANLVDREAATQERLDSISAEYAVAESKVSAARRRIEVIDTRIRSLAAARSQVEANLRVLDRRIENGVVTAPLDGIITEQYVEYGEIVSPGKPVGSIADLGTVHLTIYVGEPMLGAITLGQAASVAVDSHPDRRFGGEVSWIASEAEFTPKNVQTRDSRVDLVYAVRIRIDNTEGIFKIGMPADAYLEGLE